MKTNRLFRWAACLLLCFYSTACREEVQPLDPPAIHFDRTDKTYRVKAGKTLTVEPVVENGLGGSYCWTTSDGEVLGTGESLSYSWNESGEYYIRFQVMTPYGTAEEEILVIVAALAPPILTMPLPDGGCLVLKQGGHLLLEPQVIHGEGATFEWRVDGQPAGREQTLDFHAEQCGKHTIHLTAANEDGQDEIQFIIDVKKKNDLPFSWSFQEEYHICKDRGLYLCPMDITHAFGAEYIWKVEGEEKQRGSEPGYVFQAGQEGVYHLSVTMDNEYDQVTRELTVTVCPEEGRFRRPADLHSQAGCNRICEYLPAPGQFTNESEPDRPLRTMEEACQYAWEKMSKDSYLSLGAAGGYVVAGFDHSIVNDGGYNLQIGGNSFDGSSEPGIVYVMQDENGNGLPDDNWYELQGSESGKAGTIQDYAITYYRPGQDGMDVAWTDNQGRSGVVRYNQFHLQPTYYPRWVGTDTYTLRGTLLPSRTEQIDGIWYNGNFDWGYADNFSPTDRLQDQVSTNANHFKIAHAVTPDGRPADLEYIDFVKIQTAVNADAGIVGEVSTEILQIKDYNLLKNNQINSKTLFLK